MTLNDLKGRTGLWCAVDNCNIQLVGKILQSAQSKQSTESIPANAIGDETTVKPLPTRFDPNFVDTAFVRAASLGNMEIMDTFF